MLKVYFALPLHQSFFTAWLQSPYTVLLAYVLTVLALSLAALSGTRRVRLMSSAMVLAGVTLLLCSSRQLQRHDVCDGLVGNFVVSVAGDANRCG